MNGGYLNDGRSDGQNKIQPVLSAVKEASPIRQMRDDTNQDLHVKGDGQNKFALVQDFLMCRRDVDLTCSLKNKRC